MKMYSSALRRYSTGLPYSALLSAIMAACGIANTLPALGDDAIAPDGTQTQNSGEDTSTSKSAPELGEIIVTAQKREQRVNDVGLSIVAVTSAQLVAAGIDDITQLDKVAPGLSIAHGAEGYPIFSLRGVNLNTVTLATIPAVSTYVDEMLLPYPATAQGALLDVDHVEVLKGPQGTLFGQNATGGAINIVAAQPTNYFTSGLQIGANDFGGLNFGGFVSGPLSSTLNARLAATTDQWGAWQECFFECSQKNGAANRGALRLLLNWRPVDRLKVALNLNGNWNDGQPQQPWLKQIYIQVPGHGAPGLATYPLPPMNDRAADFDINPQEQDHTFQTALRVDYDLFDSLTLTSLSNYVNTHAYQNIDGDATAINAGVNFTRGTVETFTQEFRASGKISNPNINYVVGASYQHDKLFDELGDILAHYSGEAPGTQTFGTDTPTYRAAGIFANADWEILPKLTLTGGARYSSMREGMNGCVTGNALAAQFFNSLSDSFRGGGGLSPTTGLFVPGGCVTLDDRPAALNTPNAYLPYNAALSQYEHNVSWRGGVNYKPTEDTLLYVLVSRGFKAGSFNGGNTANATQFTPVKQEEITSYETGAKGSFLNDSLDVKAAIFYYDYVNKQLLTYQPSVFGIEPITTNIPKSQEHGVEFETTTRPFAGLTLHLGVTYVDTMAGNFQTFNALGQSVNIGGNPFNYAPTWSGSWDGDYRFGSFGSLAPFFGASGSFNSTTYADLDRSPQYRLPSYSLVNLRAGVESQKGWTAYAWVRNVGDKFYLTNLAPLVDVIAGYTGLPRTVGVTALFKFE